MRRIVSVALSVLMAVSLMLMTASAASANALAGGGYSSSYAGESDFLNLAPGASGQFVARFFNDGTQTWSPGVVGLLICLPDKVTCNVASPNQAYASGWYSSTVYKDVDATTAPGGIGFFTYSIAVPAGAAAGTATTFNGDVGLIATGTELHPDGYYQVNTTPSTTTTLTISPTSASMAVGGQQQFTVSGAPTGSTVTWSVTGGCGAVTTSGLFAATATTSATQPCTVVATAGGASVSAPITVFGPATQIACSASPSTMVANANNSTVISGTLKDVNGNVVSNAQGTNITFNNVTPSLLTPTAQQVIPTTNGVSSVTYSAVTNATGTGQIALSSGTLTTCTASITLTAPGAAVSTSASFSPNPIAADGVSTSRLRVKTLDASGNQATADNSTQISISRTSGASVCTPGSAGPTPVASGQVDFTITSTSTPGTCTYAITTNNTSVSGTSATLTTVIVGASNQLAASVSDSPATVTGVPNACDPITAIDCPTATVTIEDAAGNRETGAAGQGVAITATWTTSSSNTSGTGCPSDLKVYNGLTGALVGAGSPQTINSAAGTTTAGRSYFEFATAFATTGCTVTFTSGSLTSTTASVAFTAGAANGIACAFSPRVIFNDGSSQSVATVRVVDANGNSTGVGSYSTTFSRTSAAPVGTTLLTSSPQTMTNGKVQFTVQATTTAATDTYTASANVTATAPNNTTCDITTAASLTNY